MEDHLSENMTDQELQQLRADIHRALLEDANVPDAHEAFRLFQQSHPDNSQSSIFHHSAPTPPSPRRIRLYYLGIAAAAACLAALLVMQPWHTEPLVNKPGELLVYKANPQAGGVSVVVADKPVAITSTQAQQQGIVVGNEGEIHITPDTKISAEDRTTLLIPQGQLAHLLLDDGTRVWLSADSRLVFPRRFAQSGCREVALVGEGFFEVAPDANRPFVVDCGKVRTTVLGTQFNVRAFEGENPCVTLVSGRVVVAHGNSQLALQPHQQATLENEKLHAAEANMETVTSWLHGEFYFDGQTLRQLLIELGRWYNKDVVFATTSHLNDRLHFSCKRSTALSSILTQLRLICDAEISEHENAIVVN